VLFANGDEAFDAMVVERGTLIAIEYKSGMLPTGAKHSFTAETITAAIDEKYVVTADGDPKGTRQLHEGIKRFFAGEPIGPTQLARNDIHTIHPIIIAADPALTGPLVGHYLDKKLERRLLRSKGKHIRVAPLQLATFADIERLLRFTNSVMVTTMLEAANAKIRHSLPSGNLRQRAAAAIQGVMPGKDPIKDEWNLLLKDMRELFFGQN